VEKLDVIYPLGTGSIWDNNEIKFSIRSLVAHVPNIGNVIIVGEKPKWLSKKAIHVPCPDLYEKRYNKADTNMIHKVLEGLKHCKTENFIRLSDDHVILKKPDFTPYFLNKAPSLVLDPKLPIYKKRMIRTLLKLKEMGRHHYIYDTHTPVICNKKSFIKVFSELDYADDRGLCINTAYFNSIDIPRISLPDNLVCRVLSKQPCDLDNYTFLNYNNEGLTEQLKKCLFNRFPIRSQYEL
jgi:hypothetical protein